MIYTSDGEVYEDSLHHQFGVQTAVSGDEQPPVTASKMQSLDVQMTDPDSGQTSGYYHAKDIFDKNDFIRDVLDPEKSTNTAWGAAQGHEANPRYKGIPGELSSEPSKNIEDRTKDTRPNMADWEDHLRDTNTDRWMNEIVLNKDSVKQSYESRKDREAQQKANEGAMANSLGSQSDVDRAALQIKLDRIQQDADNSQTFQEFKNAIRGKKKDIK